MKRRDFIKGAAGLFVPAIPTLILPKEAQAQVGGLMFPGPGMPHSAGGGGVTWAFKTSATGGGGGSVTLSSMAIGTTVTSDIVVVMIACDGAAPNSVSVGGNAATPVSGASATAMDFISLWYVSGVTLSSTSSVVVGSAGTMFTVGAIVGIISGSATPTPSSGTSVAASFSDPFSISRTVPSGGIAIVGMDSANLVGSWTAATQDTVLNRGAGANWDYMAHTANGTGASITVTHPTAGNQNQGIMAAWGP